MIYTGPSGNLVRRLASPETDIQTLGEKRHYPNYILGVARWLLDLIKACWRRRLHLPEAVPRPSPRCGSRRHPNEAKPFEAESSCSRKYQ